VTRTDCGANRLACGRPVVAAHQQLSTLVVESREQSYTPRFDRDGRSAIRRGAVQDDGTCRRTADGYALPRIGSIRAGEIEQNRFRPSAIAQRGRGQREHVSQIAVPGRWYGISNTTHIREIDKFGTPEERTFPEDRGTGLIWRLSSITRLEERDGGVYAELEAIALSRDIPAVFRVFVTPIVRRVSKDSLVTSLHQTKVAIDNRLAHREQDH
jgi:hypothetical protein